VSTPSAVVHYQSAEPGSKAPACRNAVVVSEGENGQGRTLAVFFPDGMSYMEDVRHDSDPAGPPEGTWHFADWCPALGKYAPGREAANEAGEAARRESLRAEAARLGLVRSGVLSLDGIEQDQAGVHVAHCCSRHGCKYGNAECPVAQDAVKQDYPCEACEVPDQALDKAVTRLHEIEARLTTLGQRIGSSARDGEPGIIVQLARMEALQAAMACQVEEIHRALGLERDEDGTPAASVPMSGEQEDMLERLAGRGAAAIYRERAFGLRKSPHKDMPGLRITLGTAGAGSSAGLARAAEVVASDNPVWIVSRDGESGRGVVLAVIIPAADWHAPGQCCCKNCPWDNKHETR
jgi:hypothetical protein